MPNWVRNIIWSEKDAVDMLIAKYCRFDSDSGQKEMDFNTLLQMPEELNIEFGSKSEDGIRLVLTRLNPGCSYFGSPDKKLNQREYLTLKMFLARNRLIGRHESLTEVQIAEMKTKYHGSLEEPEVLGRKCFDNLQKYHAMNWYDWRIRHWGTKWNALNTVVEQNRIRFDTAWNPPLPIFAEIAVRNPEMKLEIYYADEEEGYQVGHIVLAEGKSLIDEAYENFSDQAFEVADKVWSNEEIR